MKILYFAPLAFDDLKQRPQLIAEELSKKHEVWYLEPTISRIGSFLRKNKMHRKSSYDINPLLHVIRLDGRFALPIRIQILDPLGFNTIHEKRQIKKLISQCNIIWIGFEAWFRLLPRKRTALLVYDKMDDNVLIAQNKLIKSYMENMDNRITRSADVIFVTASRFLSKLKGIESPVYLIPNGIGFEHESVNKISPKSKRKVFGYIGKIGPWFDLEAIRVIATSQPQCEVILVGPNEQKKISLPNVRYIGQVPKSEVPQWLDYFDICLYPFHKGDLLDTIDPVKVYEYLAMNKPVIAIDSLEIGKFGSHVYKYHDYLELEELAKRELKRPFTTVREVREFQLKNSWSSRVEKIEKALAAAEENRS